MNKELWEILVPTIFEDNKKPVRLKHHKKWDEYVNKISGGMTILKPVKGYWISNNDLYEDRNIPVRIACTRKEILRIAEFTKNHYRQLSIMVYKISDEVLFV